MKRPPKPEVRSFEGHPYWYDVTILKTTTNGVVYSKKQGTLLAYSDIGALDNLNDMAREIWNGSVFKATIHEVNEDGEVVAKTDTGDKQELQENGQIIVPNTYTPRDYAARRYEKEPNAWVFGSNWNGREKYPVLNLKPYMEDSKDAESGV